MYTSARSPVSISVFLPPLFLWPDVYLIYSFTLLPTTLPYTSSHFFSHRSGALDIRLVTRDSFSRAVSNCLIDSKKKSSCLNIVKISKVGEATSANCPVRVTLQALYKFAGGNSSHAIEMRGDMAQVRGLLMPIVSSCLSVLSSSHISISASTCL